MKVTENTHNRLVLEHQQSSMIYFLMAGVAFAVACFFILSPDLGDLQFAGMSALAGLLTIGVAILTGRRAARCEIVFDRSDDMLTIHWHRKRGTETQAAPLSEIEKIARESLDSPTRIEILLRGGRRLTLTPTTYNARDNHYKTIETIKTWLAL